MGPEVRVFFMDCESGSGAFWTRKDASVGFAGLRERLGGIDGGGPWRVWPGCLTWGLGLRERLWPQGRIWP